MSDVYKVNRSDIVTVADAIRTKVDTTEQLIFPSGFVVAINGIETGKTGAILTVTTPDEGVTVTVTKGELSYTKTTVSDGTAVFSGLETGSWTVTATNGMQTAQKTVDILADYDTSIIFFSALINITYPTGCVCTVTDGVITLIAPDTSGSWSCVVQNTGVWTASLDNGLRESVTITEDGQTTTIDHWYLYYNGNERTDVTGGWASVGMRRNSEAHFGSKAPEVSKGSDSVTLTMPHDTANAKYYAGIYYVIRKIDLTNVSTLSIVVGNVDNYNDVVTSLSVLSDIGTYYDDNKVAARGIATGSDRKTVDLDVSSVTGEKYIGLYIMANPYVSSNITMYTMEVR